MNGMIVACSGVISWHLPGVDNKSFQKLSESVDELGRDMKLRPPKHGAGLRHNRPQRSHLFRNVYYIYARS
jgi:hypothetical protein